jgi:hypothetical protein
MPENNSEMSLNDILQQFHNAIVHDPRVGPMHICLYSAILYVANQQGFKSPISVFSKDLMKHSKIAGIATYTRCIKELKELGIIEYIPSFNPLLGSLIYLLKVDHGM